MPKKQQNLIFRLVCRYLLFASLSPVLLMNAISSAQAEIITALNFTGGSSLTPALVARTWGYVFDVTSPVSVAGLSFYDNGGDGLNFSHAVGLWNSSSKLLASRTIDSGTVDPLDPSGKFRYKLLDSILSLPVATGYRVAGFYDTNNTDLAIRQVTSITTASGISYVTGAYIPSVALSFPTTNESAGALLGGSFVLSGNAPPLPEPGTLALLLLGSAIGFAKRRKTANSH